MPNLQADCLHYGRGQPDNALLTKKALRIKCRKRPGKSLNFSSPVDDTRTIMNRSFADIVFNFSGYYWYFTDVAPVGGMP